MNAIDMFALFTFDKGNQFIIFTFASTLRLYQVRIWLSKKLVQRTTESSHAGQFDLVMDWQRNEGNEALDLAHGGSGELS